MMISERQATIRSILKFRYGDDVYRARSETGFIVQQIRSWIEGKREPQEDIMRRFLDHSQVPKFEIIVEYKPISDVKVRRQLAIALKGHEKESGLYAFYDAMANLIYIGKSHRNLLAECYQQITTELSGNFPKGFLPPSSRLELVRYFSAYRVRNTTSVDYAKHVEALILRISKPRLNHNGGNL